MIIAQSAANSQSERRKVEARDFRNYVGQECMLIVATDQVELVESVSDVEIAIFIVPDLCQDPIHHGSQYP